MIGLRDFCNGWTLSYQEAASRIPLFADPAPSLSKEQMELFVRLFYHSRGHFYRFLWDVAMLAKSSEQRAIVIRNITDELGGENPGDLSHEQLFLGFARQFCPSIMDEEVRAGRSYEQFLADFNEGHHMALIGSDCDRRWAMFAAYELLDNVDYANLRRLAVSAGTEPDGLQFFDVHLNGTHFEETFSELEKISAKEEIITSIPSAFDSIKQHQLWMWTEMSRRVLG